jgi:hypothetical protein
MKKRFTTFLGLLMMLTLQSQAQDFESAKDAVNNMGVGWNLGNTLDAVNWEGTDGWNWSSPSEHEQGWGQPVTKPELMKMMKEAGIGAIRVPVTWFQEMDADGKVNDAFMKRVHEVVDYVIDNGMYCIINVHHDTGDHNLHWLVADGSVYSSVKAKYEYLWEQIATEFKDYDHHLLFESYNEMLDSKNTWNEPSDKTDGYNAINNYAKSFVSAVRATGGNNAERNLVINTYSASNSPAAMKALELPEESGHIIFQIHNYPDWQSESHARELVDYLISTIKTNLMSKGAPVIVGEYSTFCVWPERDWYYENREVALYAMDYFIKRTKEEGIGTFYWMGLSDGMARNEPYFNQPDLVETITKAYHGDDFEGIYPTKEISSETVVYEGEKQLEWGDAIQFPASLFSDLDNTSILEVTYTEQFDQFSGDEANSYLQFWYSDWSSMINFTADGEAISETLEVNKFYNSVSGTEHTTVFAFDADTFQKFKSKGMLFQGHGILLKKAVLKAGTTGIKAPKAIAADDAPIYNLAGQRVTKPAKGIYIKNGKKFIVK